MDEDSLNAVGGHCPVCGQEYRPGFTVCADDGAELMPGPAGVADERDEPADPASRTPGAGRTDVDDLASELGPPVELGWFPVMDAVLLAGRLRSLGIPAVSEADVNDSPYRMTSSMGGITRVFVRPEDLDRARRVAERILAGVDVDEDLGFERPGDQA